MSPTNPSDARYTLTELADLAGVTPRTVRYYLAQGLLPSVGVAGPGAKYDDTHLARLRLIKRLQADHRPLAEIRKQLETLDDSTIIQIASAPEPAPPTDSAIDYIRRVTGVLAITTAPARVARPMFRGSVAPPPAAMPPAAPPEPSAPSASTTPEPALERSQWERIALGPDIELHIRRPLARPTAKRVERLIEFARDTLTEEPS